MSLGCPTCLIREWAHSSVGGWLDGRIVRDVRDTGLWVVWANAGSCCLGKPGCFRTAHSWSKALLRLRLAGVIRGIEPYRHRVCEVCLSCQSSIGRGAGLAAH